MTSTLHVLILGKGSWELSERFGECAGTRVKCVAIEDELAEDLDMLKVAARAVERQLGQRVDYVLLMWKPSVARSTNMIFSLSESFRTCKDRVFLCVPEDALQTSLSVPLQHKFEAQSTLVFFAGRVLLMTESVSSILKTILKSKPKGSLIQMEIIASDDFINGAIERRNARKKLLTEAVGDDSARQLLERRFWTRMGGSYDSMRARVVV